MRASSSKTCAQKIHCHRPVSLNIRVIWHLCSQLCLLTRCAHALSPLFRVLDNLPYSWTVDCAYDLHKGAWIHWLVIMPTRMIGYQEISTASEFNLDSNALSPMCIPPSRGPSTVVGDRCLRPSLGKIDNRLFSDPVIGDVRLTSKEEYLSQFYLQINMYAWKRNRYLARDQYRCLEHELQTLRCRYIRSALYVEPSWQLLGVGNANLVSNANFCQATPGVRKYCQRKVRSNTKPFVFPYFL